MQDAGIIRSRAKIVATIEGARIFLAMRDAGEDFSTFAWDLAGGKPIRNTGPVPASTPLSEQISKTLKKRGFKFVGPVIVYAWMQATGMVNDHAPTCFRRTLGLVRHRQNLPLHSHPHPHIQASSDTCRAAGSGHPNLCCYLPP